MDSTRHRPRQERSKALVDAIVEAAAWLLVDEGPETTTNRIAQRAGVSVGSVYRYFPDKDAIFLEVAEGYAGRLREAVSRCAAEKHDAPIYQAVPAFMKCLVAIEEVEPRVGPPLLRMRAKGWSCPPLDQFEALLERLAIEYIRRDTPPEGSRSVVAEIVGPLMVRAVSGVIRTTLVAEPEVVHMPVFVRELSALILRFLDRGPPATEDET